MKHLKAKRFDDTTDGVNESVQALSTFGLLRQPIEQRTQRRRNGRLVNFDRMPVIFYIYPAYTEGHTKTRKTPCSMAYFIRASVISKDFFLLFSVSDPPPLRTSDLDPFDGDHVKIIPCRFE